MLTYFHAKKSQFFSSIVHPVARAGSLGTRLESSPPLLHILTLCRREWGKGGVGVRGHSQFFVTELLFIFKQDKPACRIFRQVSFFPSLSFILVLLITRSSEAASLCFCTDADQSNPAINLVGVPDLYFSTGARDPQPPLLTEFIVFFVWYHLLLFRVPITDRVWKGKGSLDPARSTKGWHRKVTKPILTISMRFL